MEMIFSLVREPLELFARSGGGGSGGSGDGGAGIVLIGYIPMHFIGAVLRRAQKKSPILWIIANITGWVIACIYGALLIFFLEFWGWITAIAAFVGMAVGLYNLVGKIRQSKVAKQRLATAAAQDSAWSEQRLVEHATAIFLRYQQDWSRLDANAVMSYATTGYAQHATLLMRILAQMGRRNLMDDVTIQQAVIVGVYDVTDDTQDAFMIGFTATAHDRLIEAADNAIIFETHEPFTEYWTFQRNGSTWLLSSIQQATIDPNSLNGQLETFAKSHGYFYSADMGVLFIPKRGYLFSGTKFTRRTSERADINNHIVGLYESTLLMQLYTYKKDYTDNGRSIVVAQATVPKSYGQIIVRRKNILGNLSGSLLHPFGVPGLKKVETEWTRFNDKYEVLATSAEQATSFELLNPTYMEQLEALGFDVTIEVVDNNVYLYTDERQTSVETYATMLDLLHKAFKEMRL